MVNLKTLQSFLRGLEPFESSCLAFTRVGTSHCSITETTVQVSRVLFTGTDQLLRA